jgi:multidrug efflux system membrane fusion protein
MTMNARRQIAIVLGCLLASACGTTERYEKPPTPVRVGVVAQQTPSGGARYSASVEPNTRVDLAFKAGGYIESIHEVRGADGRQRIVQEGDHVTRGTVLARVRTTDYDVKITQARSQLTEAQAAAAQAKESFDRASALYATKAIPRPDFEAAKGAYEMTQAKVAGATALVREAQNAANDTALVAPIDGVVLKRLVEVGSLVGPGVGGFVLADVRTVKVVFGAPDRILPTLRVGSVQPVTTEAVPNRVFDGHITRVSPTADPLTRLFNVEVSIPNQDEMLKVGMVAALEIEARGAAAAASLAVPLSAVVRSKSDPNGYAVFVVEDRDGKPTARARNVVLGKIVGNMIGVDRGVNAGERIIITGATLVVDGEAVAIVS